jgi:MFS family permease
MVIFYSASSVGFLSLIKSKEINHSIARGLEKGMENRAPAPVFYYLKKSKLLIFCFSVFLFHFANAAQLPIVVQDLSKTHEDADSLFMGASIILSQAVMIGVAYGTGFLMQIVGRKPIFLIAFAVLPLRAFLFTLTDQPLLLLAIELLDGFGVGIYGVIGVISISDISKGTGRFNFSLGLMALAQGIGASLSNTLAGFIANSYSFQAAFLTLALIALVGMSFYTFFMTETKNQAT